MAIAFLPLDHIAQQGLSVNGTDGSDAGADNYGNNWRVIRGCYTVMENIDKSSRAVASETLGTMDGR